MVSLLAKSAAEKLPQNAKMHWSRKTIRTIQHSKKLLSSAKRAAPVFSARELHLASSSAALAQRFKTHSVYPSVRFLASEVSKDNLAVSSEVSKADQEESDQKLRALEVVANYDTMGKIEFDQALRDLVNKKPPGYKEELVLMVQSVKKSRRMEFMNGRNLAGLLLNLATMKYNDRDIFIKAVEILEKGAVLRDMSPATYNNILWAYSKSGIETQRAYRALSKGMICDDILAKSEPTVLANIILNCGTVMFTDRALLEDAVAVMIKRNLLHEFSPRDLTNTLMTYARLSVRNQELFKEASKVIMEKDMLRIFSQQQLFNCLWSFSLVLSDHAFRVLRDARSEVLDRGMFDIMNPQQMTQLIFAYARVGITNAKFYSAASQALLNRELLPSLSLEQMAEVLGAFAKIGFRNPNFFDAASKVILQNDMLQRCTTEAMSNTLFAFATSGNQDRALFMAASESILKREMIPSFRHSEMTRLLGSYATLRLTDRKVFGAASAFLMQNGRVFKLEGSRMGTVLRSFALVGMKGDPILDVAQRIMDNDADTVAKCSPRQIYAVQSMLRTLVPSTRHIEQYTATE